MCWQKTTKTRNSHCRDRVHYAVSDTTPKHPKKRVDVLKVCRWSIAAGKRPVPFRTRKLSLHTLMVLQPGGCGRVSHRRHQTTKHNKIQTRRRGRLPPSSLRFTNPPIWWKASAAKPRVRLKAMEGRVWADSHLVTGPQRGKGAPSCLCSLGLLSYFYYHHTAYPVAAIGFNIGHREAASTRLGVPGLCY